MQFLKLFLVLLLLHLLLQPLALLGLLLPFAVLLGVVLAIEEGATADVLALCGVLIEDCLSCPLHISFIFEL